MDNRKEHGGRIYLSSPTTYGEEMQYIREAFETNWVAPLGKNVDELERSLTEETGSQYCVALSSGTAAIHLALKLCGVQPGSIVFCPSMTFVATANPILYEHGTPVFLDCESDTWNMDPKALEKAFISYPNPKAVLLVHLYGTPAKIDEIRELCNHHQVPLIEDAAESLGASYKKQKTGSFGEYAILSFNGNKIITTSGGGALLTANKSDAEKAKFWATQSREEEVFYEHREIGYNYRMSNISAGIGRGQLLHLGEHVAIKKKIYQAYKEGLKDLPLTMNPFLSDSNPNHWLSCILLNDSCRVRPTDLRLALENINAESRPIWKPMHLQPLYKEYPFISIGGDTSKDIFEKGLCLPSDIKMSISEQQKIIDTIHKTIKGGYRVSEIF